VLLYEIYIICIKDTAVFCGSSQLGMQVFVSAPGKLKEKMQVFGTRESGD